MRTQNWRLRVADPSPLRTKLDALEKRFGRGQTYGRQERALILDHGVPEWLVRGRRFLKGASSEDCDRMIRGLLALRKRVASELALSGLGDGL